MEAAPYCSFCREPRKRGRIYCSPRCAGAARIGRARGPYRSRGTTPVGPKTCVHCLVSFPAPRATSKYCSTSCQLIGKGRVLAAHYRGAIHHNYRRVESVCAVCAGQFQHLPSKARKFCSRSCAIAGRQKSLVQLAAERASETNRLRGHYEATRERMKAGGAAKALRAVLVPSRPQLQLFALVKAQLPDAQLEYPVGSRSVDIAVPTMRVAIEYDGARWHQDEAKDARRDSELAALGWRTIRVRYEGLRELQEIFQ